MVAVELGARGIFAFKVGPRILLYGTESYRNHYEEKEKQAVENWRQKYYSKEKRTVELHYADQDSGYAKFFPHEKKLEQDLVTGETFEVRINGAGFRGPDFATKKSTDVRVLTLGSSSTFGFYDRDTETYPYLMKKVLERQCPKYSFEVINFGIPHLTSHQILALFRSEGLPLKPDVITFYEGNNDSLIAPAPEEQSRGAAFYAGLRERLLIVNLADHLLSAKASSQLRGFDPEYSRQRTQVFLENLDAIRVLAERNGIKMVVATQQRRADFEGRERAKGVTYKQEVAELRGRLRNRGDWQGIRYRC